MEGTVTFRIGDGITKLIRDAYWFEGKHFWAFKTLDCIGPMGIEVKEAILNGDAYLKPVEDGRYLQLVYEVDMKFKNKLYQHMQFMERLDKLKQLEIDEQKKEYSFLSDWAMEKARENETLLLRMLEAQNERDITRELYNSERRLSEPSEKINIGGYEVEKHLVDVYSTEVVSRLRNAMKDGFKDMDVFEVQTLEFKRRELHDKILESIGLSDRKSDKYFQFCKALNKYIDSKANGY